MTVVVDASVAVKFGVFEAGAERARGVVARGAKIVAPDILPSEIVSALWKKQVRGELTANEADVALEASLEAYDEFAPCRELAARAMRLALLLQHPVYDCFYLALAEAREATFITADGRLLAQLGRAGWDGKFEAL